MPRLVFRLDPVTLAKVSAGAAESMSGGARGIVAKSLGYKLEEVEARWPEPDRFADNTLPFSLDVIGDFGAHPEMEPQDLHDLLRDRLLEFLGKSKEMPKQTKFDVWVMPLNGGSYKEGGPRTDDTTEG